jgi:hypothetical protein
MVWSSTFSVVSGLIKGIAIGTKLWTTTNIADGLEDLTICIEVCIVRLHIYSDSFLNPLLSNLDGFLFRFYVVVLHS